jgi:predicted RNase H-like HicB family nuclease
MLSEYLSAALKTAHYEKMENGRYYGEIPAMPGVWTDADTLEECQSKLLEVAEEWTLMAYWLHSPLPIIGGIDPNLKMTAEPDSDETAGTDSEIPQAGFSGTAPGQETSLHG